MEKLSNSLRGFYVAVRIQVFYVMLPILVFFFLWASIIRFRGQDMYFPFYEFVLLLIFIAGLRSGYEFRKRTLLYCFFGLLFIMAYFFSVVIYAGYEWNEYLENSSSFRQIALGIIKLVGVIFAAGCGGCALGKWIYNVRVKRS